MLKKIVIIFGIFLCLIFQNFAVLADDESIYPDYSYIFNGEDKWEDFNRKIFDFNLKLNKYAIRPIHILWSSIMPEFGMDRIQSMTNNIEYPIRLVSSLLQRDFEVSKTETIRFFTNTIIGLGGMFDPAKSLFDIEPVKEDMEQALASYNLNSGPYMVLPIISSITFRGILGKILDMALNPGSYIATPVLAIVKAGLTINKTSYYQSLIKMVESNYADPYEIAKKAYGIERYMKVLNLDRVDISSLIVPPKSSEIIAPKTVKKAPVVEVKKNIEKADDNVAKKEVSSVIVMPGLLKGGTNIDDMLENYGEDFRLETDMTLPNYHPQSPVVDSMRTALFQSQGIDKSIWNELSIWNRSFSNKIKTSSVNVVQGREDYNFRYLLQKDKSAPVVIIYPSIGEGINSSHSVSLAKLFFDEGYSVVILGSHFQWEFVRSMPEFYRPGLPSVDAEAVRIVTLKALDYIQDKNECVLGDKTIIGTSFGALIALFVADKEFNNNTLGRTNYISICPPIELIYAMKQVDKLSQDWEHSSDVFKHKVAEVAGKVLKLYDSREDICIDDFILPFNEEEGKLITGFIMHQKLSDLVFTIEKASKIQPGSDIYKMINNMGYQEYTKRYLLADKNDTCDDLSYETSLHYIADFLESANNYKIYHSLNDYLTNANQLKKLKQYSKDKLVLIDNGSHLGFLYRKEFILNLKNTISLHKNQKKYNKDDFVNKASLSINNQ